MIKNGARQDAMFLVKRPAELSLKKGELCQPGGGCGANGAANR